MDEQINKILLALDMSQEEIDNCYTFCPGLDIVDPDKVVENINLLIHHGYPQDDVGILLSVNPGIMMYEPSDLDKKLSSLGPDIEEVLKNDPFAI